VLSDVLALVPCAANYIRAFRVGFRDPMAAFSRNKLQFFLNYKVEEK
jgi:hypothetical protein